MYNSISPRRLITHLSMALAFGWPGWSLANDLSYIKKEHWKILSIWLQRNVSYKLATDADCNCPEDLKRIRTVSEGVWKAQPKYHPFYMVGGCNGDGADDFAVVVYQKGAKLNVSVVIFEAHRGASTSESEHVPKIVQVPYDLEEVGLFFGEPRPKPTAAPLRRRRSNLGERRGVEIRVPAREIRSARCSQPPLPSAHLIRRG